MTHRFLAILAFVWTPFVSMALELTFTEGMTLSDFYSHGIYPSFDGPASASFSVGPLSISTGSEKRVFSFEHCYGSFSFSIRNELRHGMILASDPVTVEEATRRLMSAARRLGVEPRYGTEHPDAPPSESGAKWTSMGVNYKIPESEWTLALVAKRSEEMVFFRFFLSKPTTRREDTINMQEWRTQKLLKTPEEWSHLPLRKKFYSLDREAADFLHRVASYDAQGNLLPGYEKRLEEIETKAEQEVADRAAKRAGRSVERTEKPPTETAPDPKKRTTWIAPAVALLALVLGFVVWRLRVRASATP